MLKMNISQMLCPLVICFCFYQINNIRKEIEAQNKKKDGLEASTTIAEKKIQDLSSKLENVWMLET